MSVVHSLMLGALQAVTHQLLTVTNDTYITAESVCLLLEQVASAGGALPVTVVLDNASYQRCARVAACAAHLGIALLVLPPYSPNLNLTERLGGRLPLQSPLRAVPQRRWGQELG